MLRAIVIKELREIRGIALLIAAAYLYLAMVSANPRLLPFAQGAMFTPFVHQDFFTIWFVWISLAVVIALGLRQTIGESVQGTYPFLFHRPSTRNRLMAAKLAVGSSIYLACGALAILAVGLWAAAPGTYHGPFEWSMTVQTWILWLATTVVYLGAFLVGVRPACWFGTRLFPLLAAGVLMFGVMMMYYLTYWPWLAVALILTIDAGMVAVIVLVVRTRDYS